VAGGLPSFDEGVQFGIITSILTGSTQGRMYYSDIYRTLMVDASTNMTIPIGEKEVRWIYNNTGAILEKGKAVYISSIHIGTPSTIAVSLA